MLRKSHRPARSTAYASSSDIATWTAYRAGPTATGRDTIRTGSSNWVTVPNTVSPSRSRARSAGGVGRRAVPRVALHARIRPSRSVIWTNLSSRTSEGGPAPGATSWTRTGCRGSPWIAAASVEASDRIASSMISPRTTRRSAQSAPNAATASITASTATCPSQSRVLKPSDLMAPRSPAVPPDSRRRGRYG